MASMKKPEPVTWADICEVALIQQKIINLQQKALDNLLPSAIMDRETEDAINEAKHLKEHKYWEV